MQISPDPSKCTLLGMEEPIPESFQRPKTNATDLQENKTKQDKIHQLIFLTYFAFFWGVNGGGGGAYSATRKD